MRFKKSLRISQTTTSSLKEKRFQEWWVKKWTKYSAKTLEKWFSFWSQMSNLIPLLNHPWKINRHRNVTLKRLFNSKSLMSCKDKLVSFNLIIHREWPKFRLILNWMSGSLMRQLSLSVFLELSTRRDVLMIYFEGKQVLMHQIFFNTTIIEISVKTTHLRLSILWSHLQPESLSVATDFIIFSS